MFFLVKKAKKYISNFKRRIDARNAVGRKRVGPKIKPMEKREKYKNHIFYFVTFFFEAFFFFPLSLFLREKAVELLIYGCSGFASFALFLSV